MKVKQNTVNHRKPKIAVAYLLSYTAFNRKKNKAVVDGTATMTEDVRANKRALQCATFAATQNFKCDAAARLTSTDQRIQLIEYKTRGSRV
jgi:hypothetical protein